ncbi:MAG: hypothetical protein IJX84_11790 [Clostridia bacterium]|nr:hypothetical protein [Clostridia bacterium]
MAENEKPRKGKVDYLRDRELSHVFSVKVRKSTGMVEALKEMTQNTGIPRNAYIINAVCEKLIQDGYNPDHYKPDPE